MIINKKGVDLIKEFEGCKLHAYQDQRGRWTIGYGWARNVNPGDIWTQDKADRYLAEALDDYNRAISSYLGTAPTTSNQFSAMVSLAYNIGIGNFLNSSVLRNHKLKQYDKAADSFLLWDKVNAKFNKGLHRRRVAERALYVEE